MNRSRTIVPLQVELTDVITPKSCSAFIAELIKYVAYSKQQIPYPFERLKMFVLKRRERQKTIEISSSNEDSDASVRVTFLMEKYYKKVEEAFDILDSTFKCIEQELTSLSGYPVEEIVLLFGATPISPKDVYRFQIPSMTYGHSEGQHVWRRQIANLFRGIIVSDEVNTNLQRNVGLTNMYVMLKVRKGGFTSSKWLLPKDHYRLSERAQQVCFSFSSLTSKPCTCLPVVDQDEVLSHSMTALRVCDDNMVSCEEQKLCSSNVESDEQFVWFQTSRSLKGFRDSKSQGKSVTDLWYKHRFLS